MKHIGMIPVSLHDVDQLQTISKQTFFEAFSGGNTKENMQVYLDQSFSKERLTAELQQKDSQFYFAMFENKVIGYTKVNFGRSQAELKDKNALEIERIYVLEEFQGLKVGQLLYEKALSIARQKNVDFIWLGVWEKNLRAINFYKKNGFVQFDQHLFYVGDDAQTDIMMKLEL